MILMTIVGYLSDKLSIPVYAEEPEIPPKRYVIVGNNGTSKKDNLSTSLISLQVYDTSKADSIQSGNGVCEDFEEIIELDEISAVRLNSRYSFDDVATHRYRYQAVYDVYHY